MENIPGILERYVALGDSTQDKVLGASLIVLSKNGVLFEGAAGRIGMAADSPRLTLDVSGWLASMSKIVTATALLQIVERGLIGLDDDIRSLVPELAAVQLLKPVIDNKIILEGNTNPITLRQLLTHTSGMGYDVVYPSLQQWSQSIGRRFQTLEQTREGWNTPLLFPPGSSWSYGSGIDWAGIVLEKLTGQRLGEYMLENIFKPLKMNDTTFNRQDIAERLVGRTAECCYRTPDGTLVGGPLPAPEKPPQDSGGAGLFSTARDYSFFLQALLADSQGGGKLLSKASVDEMFRPQLNDSQCKDLHGWVKDMVPFPAETPINYGISGAINMDDVDGKRRRGTLTWGGMTNSKWWIDLESGIAGVLFAHLLPQDDVIVNKLYDEVERAVYNDATIKQSRL